MSLKVPCVSEHSFPPFFFFLLMIETRGNSSQFCYLRLCCEFYIFRKKLNNNNNLVHLTTSPSKSNLHECFSFPLRFTAALDGYVCETSTATFFLMPFLPPSYRHIPHSPQNFLHFWKWKAKLSFHGTIWEKMGGIWGILGGGRGSEKRVLEVSFNKRKEGASF